MLNKLFKTVLFSILAMFVVTANVAASERDRVCGEIRYVLRTYEWAKEPTVDGAAFKKHLKECLSRGDYYNLLKEAYSKTVDPDLILQLEQMLAAESEPGDGASASLE